MFCEPVVLARSLTQRPGQAEHLFLHPAQIARPEIVTEEPDAALLEESRRVLLEWAAAENSIVLGPLFAAPGGGPVHVDEATGVHSLK